MDINKVFSTSAFSDFSKFYCRMANLQKLVKCLGLLEKSDVPRFSRDTSIHRPSTNPFNMGTASSDPDLFDPPDPDRAGHHSPAPPTIGLQPAPPAPSTVGILPRIPLPDGTSLPLGAAIPGSQALHGGQGVGNNAGARELNAFQKSDTWLPKLQKWKGRLEEIQNFRQYVEQLVI